MQWGVLSSIFFLSTFKFMVAAAPGAWYNVPFWQTYLANVSGAILSATIFFFASEFLIKRSHIKRVKKIEEANKSGTPLKLKPKFTKTNRFIIRLKWKLGVIGVTFYAPFFLSIPLGTIIAAKFYNKRRFAFPLIVLGICTNGLLTSGIPYLF